MMAGVTILFLFRGIHHDNNENKTFAKLSKTNKKNELSHRRIALDKFVKWFTQNNKLKKL